jgi:hypothetical protein
VVQSYPPKYAVVYYLRVTPQDTAGSTTRRPSGGPISTVESTSIPIEILRPILGKDTAGAGVDRTRYTGGFFLYRVGEDTFAVHFIPERLRAFFIPERLRAFSLFPQDTAGVQGVFPGGYYLFGTPQDTAGAGVDRTRYTGGYFLYALPQDTTEPAELVDYYVLNGTSQDTTEPASAARSGGPRAEIAKQWAHALAGGDRRYAPPQDTTKPAQLVDYGTPQDTTEPASAARINIKPLADRVIVEPAPAEDRRGPILVMGQFIPTHVGLPMPELELDPGDGPVCDKPPFGQGIVGFTARYTGPISLPRPSDVGIPEFRMMPPGGVVPVLWPNGNPPRNPDWPWVGVIGTPVLEGIDGASGPGKPQNWCGTEYIWTGPPPKSPKELILTPVIPRPR